MSQLGYELSPDHKRKVRDAALVREATIRQKVSIGGVVYPNFTQAAKATGISARSIKRYAHNGVPIQARRNGLLSEGQYNLAKTIKLV